jgi:hypothetical protein
LHFESRLDGEGLMESLLISLTSIAHVPTRRTSIEAFSSDRQRQITLCVRSALTLRSGQKRTFQHSPSVSALVTYRRKVVRVFRIFQILNADENDFVFLNDAERDNGASDTTISDCHSMTARWPPIKSARLNWPPWSREQTSAVNALEARRRHC